jgi:hypothetical protein
VEGWHSVLQDGGYQATTLLNENAMLSVCPFETKFASLISGVLSCFDRMIFKGYLPLCRLSELERFVDCELKLRRVDFIKQAAPEYAARLVEHAQQLAAQRGRPYEYHGGKLDKDRWAKQQLKRSPVKEGLVGVLCTKEVCPTFQLVRGPRRPEFRPAQVPQRVLYYYFLDARLGLIHVRIQTWLPFTVQVYANGHDFLARQMAQQGIGFVQQDNAFLELDDPAKAQKLADKFAKLDWPKILGKYAEIVNPLRAEILPNQSYYWVTDQAEYATDVLFRRRGDLTGLYRKLLEYAWLTFSPSDVLGFLGRSLHRRFEGEVLTDVKTERQPGARIKHRMKGNWLKLYDKFGLILRVETVINQPGEFKIYRECQHRDGTPSWGWFPMPKGVGNLHHYQRHARACNARYLAALAHVDDPAPAQRDLANLTEPKRHGSRNSTGFNPARDADQRLFAVVLAGDHLPQGFRNIDIRRKIVRSGKTPAEHRRASAAVGRLLKRLHVRGLIAKIPHSRRWKVTETGRRVLGHALQKIGRAHV